MIALFQRVNSCNVLTSTIHSHMTFYSRIIMYVYYVDIYLYRVKIRIKHTVKLLFNEKGCFISLWYRQLNNINIFMAQACGFCTGNAKVV